MSAPAALDLALTLIGEPACEAAAWTGKPRKSSKRLFAYLSAAGRRWVVKASAGPDPLLEHEHRTLGALGRRLEATAIAGSFPADSRYAPHVLVQPLLPGTPLRETAQRASTSVRDRDAFSRGCLLTMDWLKSFHALTATGPGTGGTHGDMKPSNVLIGPRVSVIDWELYEVDGTQRHDLMHFLLYTGLLVYAPDRAAGFRGTFLERTWVSDIIRACLRQYGYTSETGLAPDLRDYVAAMLARRASLGLDNRGYFLEELRERLEDLCAMGRRLPVEDV